MNYHILKGTEKQNQVNVVFHIPVPDEALASGVNLRTAISAAEPFITSSVSVGFGPAEEAALQAGELYEYSETMSYNANLSNVDKLALIAARYTELVAIVQAKFMAEYMLWGSSGNVD